MLIRISDNNDQEFHLEIGLNETFNLTVTEAGSAGYLWSFSRSNECVDIDQARIMTDDEEAIGAFSKIEYTFTGSIDGDCDVVLRHKRPWNDETIQTIILKIKVMV